MPAHGLDSLEDIDLAVLDDLLDAGVGRTVHTCTGLTIPAKERNMLKIKIRFEKDWIFRRVRKSRKGRKEGKKFIQGEIGR